MLIHRMKRLLKMHLLLCFVASLVTFMILMSLLEPNVEPPELRQMSSFRINKPQKRPETIEASTTGISSVGSIETTTGTTTPVNSIEKTTGTTTPVNSIENTTEKSSIGSPQSHIVMSSVGGIKNTTDTSSIGSIEKTTGTSSVGNNKNATGKSFTGSTVNVTGTTLVANIENKTGTSSVRSIEESTGASSVGSIENDATETSSLAGMENKTGTGSLGSIKNATGNSFVESIGNNTTGTSSVGSIANITGISSVGSMKNATGTSSVMSIDNSTAASFVGSSENGTRTSSVGSIEIATGMSSTASSENATGISSFRSNKNATKTSSVGSDENATRTSSVRSIKTPTGSALTASSENLTEISSFGSIKNDTNTSSVGSTENATGTHAVESIDNSTDISSIGGTAKALGPSIDSSGIKRILWWNKMYPKFQTLGWDSNRMNKACNNRCEFVLDKSLANTSHVIIFDAESKDWFVETVQVNGKNVTRRADPPEFRNESQYYVYWRREAPKQMISRNSLQVNRHFFNWTASYRLDSDFHILQRRVVKKKKKDLEAKYNNTKLHKEILSGKSNLVSWIVPNGNDTPTEQLNVVNELQKHIPVQIYGNGGKFKCKYTTNCYEEVGKSSKFYLAFENPHSLDHVTEGIFRALKYGMVPIVDETANYGHQLPPDSFINADSFGSAKALASHLRFLDQNDEAYLKYFKWRESYALAGIEQGTLPIFCDICERVHKDYGKKKSSLDLEKWLLHGRGKDLRFSTAAHSF